MEDPPGPAEVFEEASLGHCDSGVLEEDEVFTDMTRTSCSVAAKVPELWAKVGGGRSRVAGSGLHRGPIVPVSSDGEAGPPRAAAWGEKVADVAEGAPCAEGAGGRSPGAERPGVAWAPS